MTDEGLLQLHGGTGDDAVGLVLDARGRGLPQVLHWGRPVPDADLPGLALAAAPAVPHSALDVPLAVELLPARAAGWPGRPGLTGSRAAGRAFSPLLRQVSLERGPASARVVSADAAAGLEVVSELELAAGGVLRLRHVLTNAGDDAYRLDELALVLPVPDRATEVLDLTGRHCLERTPQRTPLQRGARVREARHGRTGHDATLVLAVGTPGCSNRTGEVWGLHLGWSGDSTSWAERLPGTPGVLAAAELLGPGEVELAPGEAYATPWAYAVTSSTGLDGLSRAFHAYVRARPGHPSTPRPVVLNTWEAVYFDHDLDRLRALADVAAEVGVERFVLDDGWFRGRRDDTAGLGDWEVDPAVWPQGLGPLVEHVHARGMAFGLWVEPEMVNVDSALHRAHPEWVLGAGDRLPPEWRHQQVLDLVHEGAYAHVRDALDALLTAYAVDYLKWDHNRDLVDAGHLGAPAVHRQTLAVYRLLDELRARHPGVEVESCASGGGRVDLGVLERTDRVWASDTNDALERQGIQRWTGLLLPPELVGAHVGPPRSHTTGRTQDLSFRAATALFGHLGVEWDVASATAAERAGLAEAVALHKQLRPLLHGGVAVHADVPEPGVTAVHGVVAQDGSEAVYAAVQLTTSVAAVPPRALLPGLDPARTYRVGPVPLAGGPATSQAAAPAWLQAGAVELSGATLGAVGVALPVLLPEQALLLRATGV